ncbi:asparaginase domain-containing protein [Sedimenticola selenatireducens]|uniref:Asparaginase n=1 Tax=Sedimenticola selenatireducens TaxID=191960 RepID=A0A2N6D1I8_9GAMM|nr:asparaginase domain-containing protein [Sedimenticola selenatireducens]PLX63564.1 MAG: asparaginase [Sedimenticola selenatireducens]
MKIKIYTTGGTIDKIYFDQKSEFQVGEPQILELLREANITFDFEVESLMRKDSLDMSDADRALIAERIRKDPNERILLTHGTDTMVETAKALVGIPGKTIVLVGSMQPARLRYSDAIFNIGYAVATVQMMPPGIYVAMNGQVFDPLHARKNVAGHRFEAI